MVRGCSIARWVGRVAAGGLPAFFLFSAATTSLAARAEEDSVPRSFFALRTVETVVVVTDDLFAEPVAEEGVR